jgi:hypothetical protein
MTLINGLQRMPDETGRVLIRPVHLNDVDSIAKLYLDVIRGDYISHGEVLDGITRDFSTQARTK